MKNKTLMKTLSALLAVVMVICSAPLSGFVGLELPDWLDFSKIFSVEAEAYTAGDFTYAVSGGEATITYCNIYVSDELVIPSTLGGYPVTSIGYEAFRKCDSLKSITIPDGVTTIGEGAFLSCYRLTSIIIPDSVTSIGDKAFCWCIYLESITIPDGVTSIGDETFNFCSSLESVTIPDTVTSIGDHAFWGCDSLTSFTIPDGVTSIGDGAFLDCDSLATIKVDENNKNYSSDSYGCLYNKYKTALIRYPAGNSRKTFTIPNSVTNIGDYAFHSCDSLTSITIPESVTNISDGAFSYCERLTSVTIPESVTSIGSSAFFCCERLTSVTIPDSVTSIGSSAFYWCERLTSITIPDRVTSIGEAAFFYCESLTSVTIPDSVTIIGEGAFDYCASLASIKVDANNKNYSSDSYGVLYNKNKTKLIQYPAGNSQKTFKIPESVTGISNGAFYCCYRLTSITIPESVTGIGNYAFNYCRSLASIKVDANNKNYSSDSYGVLYNKNKTKLIQYPAGNSQKTFTIPESVINIGDNAFQACERLITVTIGDSVTNIGDNAFRKCTNLTSVTIGDSVESIGEGAFYYCDNLESVMIPDSVTSIDDYAFSCCYSFTSITIPDSVTSIGDYAFEMCDSLTSVIIGESVTSIGDYAFRGCDSLTSVTIPDSVTSIGDYAFFGCESLTSVTIPDSVTSIGEGAFYSCDNLTDINYIGTGEQWDKISIGSYNEDLTNATLHIKSDTIKPTVSISSTNNVTTSQTVTLSLSDNVGATSYYWGTSISPSNNRFTNIPSVTSKTITKTVSEPGTYYLIAKDAAGNVSSTSSKTFYKTTLNTNGGSVSPSYVITMNGNSFVLPSASRTDYSFKGWATSNNATSATYSVGESYKPTTDTMFYAIWEKNPTTYTLSYNANGGSGAPSSQTGSTTYTISSTKPTRTGYTFLGWSKSSSATTASYKPGDKITLTSNTTLYAVWGEYEEGDKVIEAVQTNDIALIYKSTAVISVEVTGTDNYTVEYESSDPSIVSVDKDGNVTATGTGEAEITVTVTDEYGNVVEGTCIVTVSYTWWQWLIIIFLFGWIWY